MATFEDHDELEEMAGIEVQRKIELIHFRQRYNWDCGVSCVLMVLPSFQRQHLLNNFAAVCKDEGFNRSTWTIDLCYLLARYKVPHKYLTVTLGVHPGYKGYSYYEKILNKDEERVNQRFALAKTKGLDVERASVPLSHLLAHLSDGPVILLTNAHLLHCDHCKANRLSLELRKCLPWPPSFQGHYVVLCGYNLKTKKVFYRNPSLSNRICMMSFSDLEDARRSYGTDEDAILICNET